MKIHYFFYLLQSGNGLHSCLCRNASLIEAPTDYSQKFNDYLLAALDIDFLENRYGHVDFVLEKVQALENHEIQKAEWGGEGFCHTLTQTTVTFEHTTFGICPEWPQWSCTLAQYKAALQGWRKFIDMPKSIDSELIIELPES